MHIPKSNLCGGLVLARDILLTRCRLIQKGIPISNPYYLYGQPQETVGHNLVESMTDECHYTTETIHILLSTWTQMVFSLTWMISWLSSQICSICLIKMIWVCKFKLYKTLVRKSELLTLQIDDNSYICLYIILHTIIFFFWIINGSHSTAPKFPTI